MEKLRARLGNAPASPAPKRNRIATSDLTPLARPVSIVNTDHHSTIRVSTRRGPMLVVQQVEPGEGTGQKPAVPEADPDRVYAAWCNFQVSPMGTNVQMIFFRNAKTGDVLVKFLQCAQLVAMGRQEFRVLALRSADRLRQRLPLSLSEIHRLAFANSEASIR